MCGVHASLPSLPSLKRPSIIITHNDKPRRRSTHSPLIYTDTQGYLLFLPGEMEDEHETMPIGGGGEQETMPIVDEALEGEEAEAAKEQQEQQQEEDEGEDGMDAEDGEGGE